MVDVTDKTDSSFHNGHRERLRQKFIDDNLAEYELLELLLGYAIPRRDVRPLSRGLMARFDGLYNVMTAPMEKLAEYPGVGRNTAIFICAMHRALTAAYRERLETMPVFKDPNVLADYCKSLFAGKIVEEFHLFYLDANKRLIVTDMHSRGTSGWASVYFREIVRRILKLEAKYVVIAHNHPTPSREFSSADVDMTTRLNAVLSAIDVYLIDHFMVSGGILHSMRDRDLLK